MLWILLGALAVGALLAAAAHRVALAVAGVVVLVLGLGVFGVRLDHAGPYPFPRGADLTAGVVCLGLGGLLLAWARRASGAGGVSRSDRLLLALSPVAFLMGLGASLHEMEEVVILHTEGPAGAVETRLWVVDHGGTPWVLTGSETRAGRNLAANPRLVLERGGETSCRIARVSQDLETLRTISLARREKYLAARLAWAVSYPRLFYSEEQLAALQPGGPTEGVSLGTAAAYRLEPCPEG